MATTQVNKVNQKKRKNRKNKIELVFNEDKRREFLGGFRKRKLERKKKAQEKLNLDLKEERKRLKQDARESYKKMVVSHREIPELHDLLSTEYEEDEVTVKVTELSTSEIANRNNWIGENKPHYEIKESEESEGETQDDDIAGMELKKKPKVAKTEEEKVAFKTERDVKKALKKQATKNVQKSKAFQRKNKLEQQKNKKKSSRMKQERFKLRKQKHKVKGGIRDNSK